MQKGLRKVTVKGIPPEHDWGREWINDPGDEKPGTEEIDFEACRDCGLKPEDFRDKLKGERFRKWLLSQEVQPKD